MNTIIQANLNSKEPWPGLAWFEEADQPFFRGRADETAELLRLVRREPLTVLFGRSGLGKTSLLKAGLFPALRNEELLPVYVRLEHGIAAPPLRNQVWQALAAACGSETTQTSKPLPAEELWTYFHRRDAEFWSQLNRPVLPVIVFDQFEEIFTLGEIGESLRQRSAEFLFELADLVENRPPASVKKLLEQDPSAASKYEFRRATVKLVLSFREDFLAEIEQLKPQMPSLMINRLRLLPMNGTQAYAVITEAGSSLVADEDARRLLQLAWKNRPDPPVDPAEFPQMEIDPALLSVVCRELNSKRLATQPPLQRITADLMSGADREILKGFYERGMAGLDSGVRIFVEEELITQQGFRDSRDWEDAQAKPGVTSAALEQLIRRRLLRGDERQGRRRLELTHDVLAKVVMESRDHRRADVRAKQQEEELRKAAQERQRQEVRRKNKEHLFILGFAGSVVVAGVMTSLYIQAQSQKNEALSQVARTWAAVSEGLMKDHQVDPELSIEFALAALNRASKLAPFETTKLIVNLVNAINLYGRHSVSRGESQVANWSLAAIGSNLLVSAGEDGTFMIWTMNLDSSIRTIKANLADPVFLRLSNGNIIAGGVLAEDEAITKAGSVRLQLWNSDLSKILKEKEPKLLPGITYIRQLPSNGNLVAVDFEGKPWLLKQDLSKDPNRLRFNLNSAITSLTVLNSGDMSDKILVSVKDGNNFRLEIWSADLLKRFAYAELGTEQITSLIQLKHKNNTTDNSDSTIVSGTYNGTLQLWNSRLEKIGSSIESQSRAILSLAQLDSGELISGSADGTLRRWRVSKDGLSAFNLPFPANQSKVSTLLALQSSLISGGSNGLLKKWEWEKDSSANNPSRRTSEAGVVMVTPLGEGMVYRLATSSKPKEYLLKFGPAGKKLAELTETRLEGQVGSPILSLLLLKRDKNLATGHENGTVQRWKYNPKGKVWLRVGEAFRLDDSLKLGGIWSMAELRNDDLVLGTNQAFMLPIRFKGVKWFQQSEPCRPMPTKDVPKELLGNQNEALGNKISSLATLDNSDLVSGSSNGTIVRWDLPDKHWCRMRSIALGNDSPQIFSITELSDRTMLSANENGGLTMWKWREKLETPPLWKFWRWKTRSQDNVQGKVQDIDKLPTIYWKGPGQQIASVAALPNQRGLVVADFTGRSKIYPDRDEAIKRGCEALRQKFKEEMDHENPGNQARKPFENEARLICRKFINENPKTSRGKN
jgi:WD40 repeat protein